MENYILYGIIVVLLIAIVFLYKKNKTPLSKSTSTASVMDIVPKIKKEVVRTKETEYYENGRSVKMTYECADGIKDGKEELYYPSGKLNRTRFWKNGVLDGEMTVYYMSGLVYIKGQYKKGNLSGNYTVYKENGDLLTIKQY